MNGQNGLQKSFEEWKKKEIFLSGQQIENFLSNQQGCAASSPLWTKKIHEKSFRNLTKLMMI